MNQTNKNRFIMIAIFIAVLTFSTVIMPALLNSNVKDVDYGTFLSMLENGEIKTVQTDDSYVYYTDNTSQEAAYRTPSFEDPELVDRLKEAGVEFASIPRREIPPIISFLLSWVLPFGLLFLFYRYVGKKLMSSMGQGGLGNSPMSFGKSNPKVYDDSDADGNSTGIKFEDVAGEDEAKEALTEIVHYLHAPKKYAEIGATMPKGALLVGPPGTGKTLLAKAVAGEAGVPFFSISGSEFVEMFVGMGASKVRDLFKKAKEKAPCIIFIDEIDTIGKKRDARGFGGGNDEREQTLNQLLSEMDGFDGTSGIIILGATNRPETLDHALLRPGRFDRRVPVELPDLKGREEILKVHAKKIKLSDAIDFNRIARMAPGASGAELANMINESALRAVKLGRKIVLQEDLEESIETVIAGYQKKNKILSNKEKLIVAYHEVGHALVAALQTHTAPVTKITIIPRTSGALGYTMQVDEDEKNLQSKTEMENKIAVFTGGRVAEELIFDSITSGASNDIEQATKIARAMITRFGMNDEFGMVAFETVDNPYLGADTSLACSPETSARIDRLVVSLVQKQYSKAKSLLEENIEKLHELAKFLYDKETITGEEFMDILEGKYSDTPAPDVAAAEVNDKETPLNQGKLQGPSFA